ncbi:MAG: tetraacyldisaccharide 4'-kinase [Rickettsiales bacterium]|jgi:tetraacyldisaccharide 4'-kinase|nr:tetraacyldisaccharide 4'-kinase [Rickettsiales bacterium]
MKNAIWFNRLNILALALMPVGFMVRIFGWRFRRRRNSKLKIISIENITGFDAGRTEIIREIAKYMNAAVVLGGYGRGRIARENDPVSEIGAEAKMIAKSGLEVWVGNKSESVQSLEIKDQKVSAVVAAGPVPVKNAVRILLFDGASAAGNGLFWPAGPLRRGIVSAVKSADAVLLAGTPGAGSARILRIAKRKKKPVFFVRKDFDTDGLFGKYAAFGDGPELFGALGGILSVRLVDKIRFPAGRVYNKNDIIKLFRAAKAFEARLITDEKNWVRLPSNIRAKVRFVPVRVGLQPNFYLWLERRVAADITGVRI